MGGDKEMNPKESQACTTLYVSDLDGTLLNQEARISERSRTMLNEAIAKGALFTIATARTPATVAGIMEGINVRLPLVVMTGATLWDATTHRYSHTHFIPEEEVRKAIEIYRKCGFSSFVYTLRSDMIYIYHIGDLSEQERKFMHERIDSPFKRFEIPPDGESRLPEKLDNVVLLYGIRPTEISMAAHREVCREVNCSALCYHDIYGDEIAVSEIFSTQSTKANAVKLLAGSIGADRIVAFGDNINDLPMLAAADVAVAVADAVDEVKAAADIIIGPNTEDAVPRFILHDMEQMRIK